MRCHWFGELPARPDPDAWREPEANVPIVVFDCPGCHLAWRARVIGNDVESLPVESADELEPALFDLGDGD
jgi:hypothetical protein